MLVIEQQHEKKNKKRCWIVGFPLILRRSARRKATRRPRDYLPDRAKSNDQSTCHGARPGPKLAPTVYAALLRAPQPRTRGKTPGRKRSRCQCAKKCIRYMWDIHRTLLISRPNRPASYSTITTRKHTKKSRVHLVRRVTVVLRSNTEGTFETCTKTSPYHTIPYHTIPHYTPQHSLPYHSLGTASYLDTVNEAVSLDLDLLSRLVDVESFVAFHRDAVSSEVSLNLSDHNTAILSNVNTRKKKTYIKL